MNQEDKINRFMNFFAEVKHRNFCDVECNTKDQIGFDGNACCALRSLRVAMKEQTNFWHCTLVALEVSDVRCPPFAGDKLVNGPYVAGMIDRLAGFGVTQWTEAPV